MNKIINFLICLLVFTNISFGQTNDSIVENDSISTQKIHPLNYYKNFGPPYYPEVKLTDEDSLSWPIVYDLSMDFLDIKDLDVNNNFFIGKFLFSTYSKYGFQYMTKDGEDLPMRHSDWVAIYLKESDKRFLGTLIELDRDGLYVVYDKASDADPSAIENDLENSPSLYENMFSKTSVLIENEFDHKWDLGSYPFDTQKLVFEFQTALDTSIVAIHPSTKFPSTFKKT